MREGEGGKEGVEWSSQQGVWLGRRYLHYRVLVVLVLWVTAEQHGRAALAIGYKRFSRSAALTERDATTEVCNIN